MTSFEESPVVNENALVLQKRNSTLKFHVLGLLADIYSA